MYAKYREFKSVFVSEGYFEYVDIKCFRDALVKLRVGLLPLSNSAFKNVFSCDTTGLYCYCNETEDERHFICFCPLYENIRVRYLNGMLTRPQSYNKLLMCDTIHTSRNLGAFVFYAMRIRHDYVENVYSLVNNG